MAPRRFTLPALVEKALSRQFMWTTVLLILIPVAAVTAAVAFTAIDVDEAQSYVDILVKLVALVVGGAWAINRYLTSRTDAPHLRLSSRAELVETGTTANSEKALLLYRIEVVNTGRVLVSDYSIEVEVASVEVSEAAMEPEYYVLAEVPPHHGGPIEPGSWAAVSGTVLAPSDLAAVRLAATIVSLAGESWTWHELVAVSGARSESR
jgi:hypothetical protein